MTPDGLILVDKTEGLTSFGTDIAMRKVLSTKKVGHLGTLDPFATGLLPVFAGKGLKYLRFCDGYDKSYNCRAMFGAATDSMDSEGETVSENYPDADQMKELESTDFAMVRQAFAEVAKTTLQMPPKYSAKKINGRKAYDLARAGVEFELKPVDIKIYSLVINSIEPLDKGFVVDFDVSCSKGTYIRTICDDAGRLTGFGAHAISLRRTSCGPFKVEDARTIDQIREMKDNGDMSFILPASLALSDMPYIDLTSRQAKDLSFGKKIDCDEDLEEGKLYRAMFDGRLIAVIYPATESGRKLFRIERLFAGD
ncbi:MAG: tRNA pseudouridine(55) synthase TruB [Saccharofermentans sp.]|nr:tRNA pseudouridine(55) synthase TruB [Saccharofermentans sp.]